MKLHATCVAVGGRGVLIRGPSGAGKSDLALRLIDAGGELVSDDYVEIEEQAATLVARPPVAIEGLMEVRGLGVVSVPFRHQATLALIVDLTSAAEIPRLPESETVTLDGLAGCALRRIQVAPFEASAAAKVRLALSAPAGATA
jgi:serine kinase of HPr protein (carbohydrate metabolism regulator)